MKREDEKKICDQMISDAVGYGDTCFENMLDTDKQKLIGAYILSKDLVEAWEIITEHRDRYFPHYIAGYMLRGNSVMLMKHLTDAIRPYVENKIQDLLDEQVANIASALEER